MDLIQQANDLGFIAVGFSRPSIPLFFDRFCAWIAEGKQGGMSWLSRHLDLRKDPCRLLKGCRTVISLAYPYSPRKPCTPDGLSTARYTEPRKRDYHHRLRTRAKILAESLCESFPGARTRVCVDSAPLLERSFACQSGIGFIGKNTQFIVPGRGSYLFLAEILTTAVLPFSPAIPVENACGSCTRCLDACPTGALEAPYRLNAARCLSYRTIEDKERMDGATGQKMGRCFFGCDVCQEVCPLNGKPAYEEVILPSTADILNMADDAFEEAWGKTAFARAGLEKIKDNIRAMHRVGSRQAAN